MGNEWRSERKESEREREQRGGKWVLLVSSAEGLKTGSGRERREGKKKDETLCVVNGDDDDEEEEKAERGEKQRVKGDTNSNGHYKGSP